MEINYYSEFDQVSPYDATPYTDSFLYRSSIATPPPVNPYPVPATTGDELIEVAFSASNGVTYDTQVNLTKATIKAIGPGGQVNFGTLTGEEVQLLRSAGSTVEQQGIIDAIIVAIVGAIVGFVITATWDNWQDSRECQRGVISGNLRLSAQMQACQRQGLRGEVMQGSSSADCGASASAICI